MASVFEGDGSRDRRRSGEDGDHVVIVAGRQEGTVVRAIPPGGARFGPEEELSPAVEDLHLTLREELESSHDLSLIHISEPTRPY